MFADLMEWLQSMVTVISDQQLSLQDALIFDDTIRGFKPETLADSWMQSFAVAGRILATFGKDLNAFYSFAEVNVDLTVLAVVFPFHAHTS
jgi:hypothetical protein